MGLIFVFPIWAHNIYHEDRSVLNLFTLKLEASQVGLTRFFFLPFSEPVVVESSVTCSVKNYVLHPIYIFEANYDIYNFCITEAS